MRNNLEVIPKTLQQREMTFLDNVLVAVVVVLDKARDLY